MNKQTKFLEEPKGFLDFNFWKNVWRKINALFNGQILDERGNVIGTVDYTDGNTTWRFKSTSQAQLTIEEYDPTKSYSRPAIVFFTPDGGAAGSYYPLVDNIPAGISPDVGAPYWGAFPNSPPGVWA